MLRLPLTSSHDLIAWTLCTAWSLCYENLISDLSQLPLCAATYDPRLVEEGHSRPVSRLGALQISQGIQPLGRWSLPARFATTHSTCLPSSHEATDSTVDAYDTRGYAMSLAAARFSSPSYPSIARSYSEVYIRSLGVYVPYLQLPSTGITPFSMSEGDNTSYGVPLDVFPPQVEYVNA